jgi:hypothetical protein
LSDFIFAFFRFSVALDDLLTEYSAVHKSALLKLESQNCYKKQPVNGIFIGAFTSECCGAIRAEPRSTKRAFAAIDCGVAVAGTADL